MSKKTRDQRRETRDRAADPAWLLLRSTVKSVLPCAVHTQGLQIAHTYLTDGAGLDAFARADGFAGWAEMRDWFDRRYGLPFAGECIEWRFPAASDGGVKSRPGRESEALGAPTPVGAAIPPPRDQVTPADFLRVC